MAGVKDVGVMSTSNQHRHVLFASPPVRLSARRSWVIGSTCPLRRAHGAPVPPPTRGATRMATPPPPGGSEPPPSTAAGLEAAAAASSAAAAAGSAAAEAMDPVAAVTAGGVPPIPPSLSASVTQAAFSCSVALRAGATRLFVEVDTTAGDSTYTMLKNSLPITRMLADALREDLAAVAGSGASATPWDPKAVLVILPDAGAAALAARDWGPAAWYTVTGLETATITPTTAAVVLVCPRASEVTGMERLVEASLEREADPLPFLIVNPDVVDMGVTGLSLNARQLRERVMRRFDTVYCLRTFDWGVLLRAAPGPWTVWRDAPGTVTGFELIAQREERPSSDDIIDIFNAAEGGGGERPEGGFAARLSRFLKVYMKG